MTRPGRIRYPLSTRLFFAWKVLLGVPTSMEYGPGDQSKIEFVGRAEAGRVYGAMR